MRCLWLCAHRWSLKLLNISDLHGCKLFAMALLPVVFCFYGISHRQCMVFKTIQGLLEFRKVAGQVKTFKEAKLIFKARQHSKWLQQHPRYNKPDPCHLLSKQATFFRLCAGHNHLNHHLFQSGEAEIASQNSAPIRPAACQQNTCYRHALNTTPSGVSSGRWRFRCQRSCSAVWATLQCTAAFVQTTGDSI